MQIIFLGLIFLLGYLIGSISPGYFFGKIVRHIDIRRFGNKNTGATNTYFVVGPVFGILTGIFDSLKASFVYFLAVSGALPFVSLSPDLGILAGLAAVVGHIKPFYLDFRGGKGVASLLGLCGITIFYTRSVFSLIFLIGAIVYAIKVSKTLNFTHPLRQFLKLILLAIPISAIWLPGNLILPIVTGFFVLFAIFDAIRILTPSINQRYLHLAIFAKSKEKLRPSGATLVFLSSLLVFWFFPKEIAIFSLICFLLGDSLAPLGQKIFPTPLLAGKTLGGAGIYVVSSIISGLFLVSLTPISLSLSLILTAALVAATLDQLSFLLDDNLLVPVGTALALTVLSVTFY